MTTHEQTRQRLVAADPKVEKLIADAVRCGMRVPDADMQRLMMEDFSPRIETICSRIGDPQLRHELREFVRDALDCHAFYELSMQHAKSQGFLPGWAGKKFEQRYGLWPKFQPLQRGRIARVA